VYGAVIRHTEFRLSRGESASSTSLSSSSKSVSNISVASDSGRCRGASAFMLKNESFESRVWNISTRGSIGEVGDARG